MAKAKVPVLEALGALEKLAQADARLDRLERLGELAKRRLRFWRSFAVIAAGAALVLGFALWQSLQRCPCDFQPQGLRDQSLKGF